ncbi:MAG: hypothetical protein QOH67_4666 [Hyphomicrobiales bacterium]|nr:hypothetical protein [Hyphomicrobiales bacterium]
MVPDEGIEPPTFGLQNRCSTAELIRLPERMRRAAKYQPRGVATRLSGARRFSTVIPAERSESRDP